MCYEWNIRINCTINCIAHHFILQKSKKDLASHAVAPVEAFVYVLGCLLPRMHATARVANLQTNVGASYPISLSTVRLDSGRGPVYMEGVYH